MNTQNNSVITTETVEKIINGGLESSTVKQKFGRLYSLIWSTNLDMKKAEEALSGMVTVETFSRLAHWSTQDIVKTNKKFELLKKAEEKITHKYNEAEAWAEDKEVAVETMLTVLEEIVADRTRKALGSARYGTHRSTSEVANIVEEAEMMAVAELAYELNGFGF
jgi:hypothetical protein